MAMLTGLSDLIVRWAMDQAVSTPECPHSPEVSCRDGNTIHAIATSRAHRAGVTAPARLDHRASAKLMGRSPSTPSRQLRRNRCEAGYASQPAQRFCQQRRIAARPCPKLHPEGTLWRVVCDLPSWRCSPQQIAATPRRMHPDEPAWHVSHETIYSAIYAYLRGRTSQAAHCPAAPGQEQPPAALRRAGSARADPRDGQHPRAPARGQ